MDTRVFWNWRYSHVALPVYEDPLKGYDATVDARRTLGRAVETVVIEGYRRSDCSYHSRAQQSSLGILVLATADTLYRPYSNV
jgi:hypothetical protein